MDVHAYETWLKSWGAADSTVSSRVAVVRVADRQLNLMTATTADLERWLANPAFGAWTRATYYSHLRSVFDWLTKTGQRPDNPAMQLRRPMVKRGKPRPLSPAEQVLVLAQASGHVRTWMLLGMFAGLRAFEMVKLRGEDVTEETLFVRGKGGKDAVLPTHPLIWEAAQGYPRVGWWFPSERAAEGHIHRKTVSIATTRLFRSVGIPVGSSHRARHTYGTVLLRNGNNIRVVQELLRHASLATTQVYTEVADDELLRAVRSLGAA